MSTPSSISKCIIEGKYCSVNTFLSPHSPWVSSSIALSCPPIIRTRLASVTPLSSSLSLGDSAMICTACSSSPRLYPSRIIRMTVRSRLKGGNVVSFVLKHRYPSLGVFYCAHSTIAHCEFLVVKSICFLLKYSIFVLVMGNFLLYGLWNAVPPRQWNSTLVLHLQIQR